MTSSSGRDQAADAQYLYDPRGAKYDDSWHPRFARHIVELAGPQAGEKVLDLACGTGLVSFSASHAVGAQGSVVGVDISSGMLEQARRKLSSHGLKNVTLFQHSITDLDTLGALKGQQFDIVTCASALVLLEDAGKAIRHWTQYLRPGGRIIVDATHPQSQLIGITMERVGMRMQKPVPYYRLPFQKPDDLKTVMEKAGLRDVEIKLVSQMAIEGTEQLKDYISDPKKPRIDAEYSKEDADALFEEHLKWRANVGFVEPPEVREQAKKMFKEEWSKLADADGRVREVDMVFVGISTKP